MNKPTTAHKYFSGIFQTADYTPYFTPSGEVRAYDIEIFGALPLPKGVSVLAEDVYIRAASGGNNHSRLSRLPKGAVVGYYPRGGGAANRLFSSEFAS